MTEAPVNDCAYGPQGFSSSVSCGLGGDLAELAIVILHGRNEGTWKEKGLAASSDRFNYDYSDKELMEIAASIKGIAQAVPERTG